MKSTQSAATKRRSNRLCISKTAGVNRQSSKHTRHVSGGRREKAGGLFARQNLQSRFRALRGDNPTHPPIEEGGAFGHPSRKCPICQNPTQKAYKYCPECGTNLGEIEKKEGYSIERIRNMWTYKGGEDFYNNFKSLENAGAMPYKKVKPIRPILGDFISLHVSNLKLLSILSLQPNCSKDFSEIYRLMGYYSADHALKTMKLSSIVDIVSKTGMFSKILSYNEIQKALYVGWIKTNEAIVKVSEIDTKGRYITFNIEEDAVFYLKASKPISIVDLNLLGGNLEAVCNKKCIGEEINVKGKRYFRYQFHDKKSNIDYPYTILGREEYERIVSDLIEHIVENKPSGRVKLDDKVHISGEQVDTYFIIKASEGHRILEKYAGVKCGIKLAEKALIRGEDDALAYAKRIFEQEKIGLLKTHKKDDRITIELTESAYSSGVKNINMKLDLFPAGIIEGILKQATNENWTAEETQCKAQGHENCEIVCKIVK